MRLANWCLPAFVLALNSYGSAWAEESPDAIADRLSLKFIEKEHIVEIIENDGAWGATAKALFDALQGILDNATVPTTPTEEEEEWAEIEKLRGLVEQGLVDVMDLLPEPAARAAWLDAHEALEEKLSILVEAESAGKRLAKQHDSYELVLGQLSKISEFKSKQDVALPSNIVPASFWMEAAREKSNVYRYDQKPIESTALLAKAFENAAANTAQSAGQLQSSLNKELRAYLRRIRDERTERQYLAWNDYLTLWGNELAEADADDTNVFSTSSPAHLRAAYTQASEAILKLGKKIDELHQAAADTGELQAASDSGSTAASTVGTLSGPPHHARKMSRILRRHERIMRRIRAHY